MEIFAIWIVSIVAGCLIGSAKGRTGSGFLWTFLFGPLGIIIVLLLSDPGKEEYEARVAFAAHKQTQRQIELQQAQLRQLQELTERAVSPPVAGAPVAYHVAQNGKDLGEMSVTKIQQMLRAGTLSKRDHYFDPQMDQWIEIEYLDGVS